MDSEKVIKGLERCLICDISVVAPEEAQKAYLECEYTVGLYCGQKKLFRDAITILKEKQEQIDKLIEESASNAEMAEGYAELLKEQEAVYPSWQNGKMYCGHCGSKFPPRVMVRFCHRCGVPIKLKVNDIVEQEGR